MDFCYSVQSVLKLTPEILTIHSKNRTKNVILEEIQLLQIDEFYQICTIYALTQPLILEKFPENGMSNFLLILNYLVKKPIIYQFSWNFVLKRQKSAKIKCCYLVDLEILKPKSEEELRMEQIIEYKIEDIGDDDGEALDLLEMDKIWTSGFWLLK